MDRKVVVVAESEREVTDVVDHLRSEKGYEVVFCKLGPETILCIRRAQPDAVVVRVLRPEHLILELVGILRSDPSTSAAPIVVCCTETPECEPLRKQWQMQGIFLTEFPCGGVEFSEMIEKAMASRWNPRT